MAKKSRNLDKDIGTATTVESGVQPTDSPESPAATVENAHAVGIMNFATYARRKKKKKKDELAKGRDPLADQLTAVPGVSDRGIEARRADPKKTGVMAHGYGRTTDPATHMKRARNYFKSILQAQRAVPAPNLPKSEPIEKGLHPRSRLAFGNHAQQPSSNNHLSPYEPTKTGNSRSFSKEYLREFHRRKLKNLQNQPKANLPKMEKLEPQPVNPKDPILNPDKTAQKPASDSYKKKTPLKKDTFRPSTGFGSVTVKEPPKQSLGTVTVKETPKPPGFGRVIMKSRKFGVSPQALKQQAAALNPIKAPTVPAAPEITHVAGVQIPPDVHGHFKTGEVVPYDHPARETAVDFVHKVWRQNKPEGKRMSVKLLGVGDPDDPSLNTVNNKPGYSTIKSELQKDENDGWTKHSDRISHPQHGTIRWMPIAGHMGEHPKAGWVKPDHPNMTGQQEVDHLKNKMQNLTAKHSVKKTEAPIRKEEGSDPAAPPKYNPKTERPNQRARVADVKAQMMADPSKTKVSLSTSNSKLAKDGVASFNLVPIETCPGAGSCAKYCYADTGSYLRFHKTTMPPRVANWLASQKDDFVPKMIDLVAQHKKKGKIKGIRIHDSGDFYSPEYIDKWTQIAAAHPDMKFYAYTKSHHPKLRERLNELEKLPNVNIVQSFGSKYDHLIDPSKPHAVVFPSEESMHRAGYADAMSTDLTASDKNNKKVGLYIHGQYDKSYPGLQEHIKGNPQIAAEINAALGANGGKIEKNEKLGLRKLLKSKA